MNQFIDGDKILANCVCVNARLALMAFKKEFEIPELVKGVHVILESDGDSPSCFAWPYLLSVSCEKCNGSGYVPTEYGKQLIEVFKVYLRK